MLSAHVFVDGHIGAKIHRGLVKTLDKQAPRGSINSANVSETVIGALKISIETTRCQNPTKKRIATIKKHFTKAVLSMYY